MSIQSAQNYGVWNRADRFGHDLVASDGNGDLTGENVEISAIRHFSIGELLPIETNEAVGSTVDRAVKLNDIMEMRAQMAMNPLEGDRQINALLDLDEQLIMTGRIDRELITELYPDIEAYMYGLLMEDDKTAEAVGEILDPVASGVDVLPPEFPDSPRRVLELLERQSAEESMQILDVLIAQGLVQQIEAIREAVADPLESPLVAA